MAAFGDRCLRAKPFYRTKSLLNCLFFFKFIYGPLYLEDKGHPESSQRSMESMELTPVVTAVIKAECSNSLIHKMFNRTNLKC